MVCTVTESEWADPYEVALFDCYFDWKAGLHTCGRPMSESLELEGRDDPQYVIGTRICLGCKELEQHRASRVKGDERLREEGINPDVWRIDQVYSRAEAEALYREQHSK